MIKELTEKRDSGSVSWIISIHQTEIGIRYQRHRARCQIIIRIQDPTFSTKLHKSVANRIRWRRELWQMEHATKIP
jgi:hypothetical protein